MLELKSAAFTAMILPGTAVFLMIYYYAPAACNDHTLESLCKEAKMLYLLCVLFKMSLCPLV